MSKIIRSYQVTLCPDGQPDLAHDPITVNLAYDEEKAGTIDRVGARALAEATKRAITLEHRDHVGNITVDLVAADVEFQRERLVTR